MRPAQKAPENIGTISHEYHAWPASMRPAQKAPENVPNLDIILMPYVLLQ